MNQREMYMQRAKLSDVADIWEDEGSICYHGDAMKHFIAKSMVGYILRKNDHVFTTELEFDNQKIADIMDLNTFIIYELESNYTKKDMQEKVDNFRPYENVRDVIVIDPQGLSDNIDCMREELEQELVL